MSQFQPTFCIRARLQSCRTFKLEVAAEASNLLNHTEFNGGALNGASSTAYVGSLGNPNLVNSPGTGLIPGLGTSSTYGTMGVGTFDPRQITMHARVVF